VENVVIVVGGGIKIGRCPSELLASPTLLSPSNNTYQSLHSYLKHSSWVTPSLPSTSHGTIGVRWAISNRFSSKAEYEAAIATPDKFVIIFAYDTEVHPKAEEYVLPSQPFLALN